MAFIRKPRTTTTILIAAPAFADALKLRQYDRAAKIVVHNALSNLGIVGIMTALDHAISIEKRSLQRMGLK